jgi:hypothetical protein
MLGEVQVELQISKIDDYYYLYQATSKVIRFVDGMLLPFKTKPILSGTSTSTGRGITQYMPLFFCFDQKIIRHVMTGHQARFKTIEPG